LIIEEMLWGWLWLELLTEVLPDFAVETGRLGLDSSGASREFSTYVGKFNKMFSPTNFKGNMYSKDPKT
jgi:hypothetical protein